MWDRRYNFALWEAQQHELKALVGPRKVVHQERRQICCQSLASLDDKIGERRAGTGSAQKRCNSGQHELPRSLLLGTVDAVQEFLQRPKASI